MNKKKLGCGETLLLLIIAFAVLGAAVKKTADQDSYDDTSSYLSESGSSEKSIITKAAKATPTPDPILGEKTSFLDLTIGNIGRYDDIYIGLQYIKVMDHLPTALGTEDVGEGKEVVLAFFEFYNGENSPVEAKPDKITCYADGTQVGGVETYIKVEADGVRQFYYETLESGCKLLDVRDFEVSKGWNELKFYYGSECVWTVSSNEACKDKFVNKTLFSIDNIHGDTPIDEVVYSDKYEVVYKGTLLYKHDNIVYGEQPFAIFKFHITNNSDEELETSLMGYKMKAYQNDYLLDNADFVLDDKIGNFINIYDVDTIAPHMSADVYVAFEVEDIESKLQMVYDDGYISNNKLGCVFATVK